MFLLEIHFDKIYQTKNRLSVVEYFKRFLDLNRFIDMSNIIIMKLDLLSVISIFIREYYEALNKHHGRLFVEEMLTGNNQNNRKAPSKGILIQILKERYMNTLIVWYNEHKNEYLANLAMMKENDIDVMISMAFVSRLYY